jgi:hypothetical protein
MDNRKPSWQLSGGLYGKPAAIAGIKFLPGGGRIAGASREKR